MKLLLSLLLLSVLALAASSQSTNGWKLIWSDEFDGNHVDENKWQFQIGTKTPGGPENWGNNEAQYYTKENTTVKNGQMIITAKRQDYHGKKYTSSRLWTKPGVAPGFKGFSTTYGKIEARISLPVGIAGMWPAFWMMPQDSKYGGWAASGELDIMEAKGRHAHHSYGTIHYGGKWPKNEHKGGQFVPSHGDLTAYYTYGVEWEHGKIKWYVDNNVFYTADNWWTTGGSFPAPFNANFYIIMNLAVGGDFDGGVLPPHGFKEASMKIDYVRCYRRDNSYFVQSLLTKSKLFNNDFIREAEQTGLELVESGLIDMDKFTYVFDAIYSNADALQFVLEAELLQEGDHVYSEEQQYHFFGKELQEMSL